MISIVGFIILQSLPNWKRLNVGTVPTFKMHNVGTVPMFEMHNLGTVPTYKMHNVGTVLTFKMHNKGTPNLYYFFCLNLDCMVKINDRSLRPFLYLSPLQMLTLLAMSLTPINSSAWHNLYDHVVQTLDHCMDLSSTVT